MTGGWIKLHRKVRQSFVWTDANQLKLWMLLLMKAAHEPSKFLFNGKEICVTSGQLVTGAHVLASEFNEGVKRDNLVTWRTLWRWVKRFENEEMLTIKSTTKYSVITILNWNEYQGTDNLVTINGQSSDNPVTTYKNLRTKELSAAAVSAENPFTFYQENGFGMLNGINAEQIQGWVDDFENAGSPEPTAMVIKAMQTAVDRNKVSWGYARGILSNWDRRNIRSLAAVEADQKSYEAKQVSNGRSKQPPKPRENFDREYTQEDGKW